MLVIYFASLALSCSGTRGLPSPLIATKKVWVVTFRVFGHPCVRTQGMKRWGYSLGFRV